MIAEDSMNIFALQFKMNWNTNMESVVFNNQGEFWCTLKINSDWGAMLSLTSQYAVNQAIPLREYQLICISTRASKEHLLVNGRTTVLNDNIDIIEALLKAGLKNAGNKNKNGKTSEELTKNQAILLLLKSIEKDDKKVI